MSKPSIGDVRMKFEINPEQGMCNVELQLF